MMRFASVALLCLLMLGVMSATAEARHGYRVRVRAAYAPVYGVPAYYMPAVPVAVAPILPYGSPFYHGPYIAPGAYVGPSPFFNPARAYGTYYYGSPYGW